MARQSAVNPPTGPSPAPPHPPLSPSPPTRARNTRFILPIFDDVEDVFLYRLGGHHPVNLGDVVERKFKIIHKLGHGGFAIVWLAQDLDQHRYVALKILRADGSDREIKVLEHLKDTASDARVTTLYETFPIHGPNGIHQCLVLEFGGPSLDLLTLHCEHNRPSLSFLRTASRKLAEGVAAIHSAGVCHGDLTHNNVLFEIAGFQDWSVDDIYRFLGPPKMDPLLLRDGTSAPESAPTHVVEAIDYSHFDTDLLSGNILIADFGEAFFATDPPSRLGTPVSFLAPELLFGYAPSPAADLWALGCLTFEFHAFQFLIPTAFGTCEEAVGMAIETIGALPEGWRHTYYREGHIKEIKPGEVDRWFDDSIQRLRPLDSQVRKKMPDLSQDQCDMLVQLLKSVLVFEPGLRVSAAEVARHPWFTCEL